MSITVSDPTFLKRLPGMRGRVVLKDATGTTLGRLNTIWPEPIPPRSRFHFVDHLFDPDLIGALAQAETLVELVAPNGERLGRFEPDRLAKYPIGHGCPLTEEDLEVRAGDRRSKGHTLAEVWAIIHEKYVGADVEPLFVTNAG